MENSEKTALFGGSFDPVTNAHKDIIAALSERFDRVVVMPAAISPFKTANLPSASGEERCEMLKRAVRGLENVTVSKYELNRKKVSYTVDTVLHLKKKYKTDSVYTVIGSEELPFLNKWRDPETLKRETVFYVVERNGFPADKSAQKARDNGFKVRIAPFSVGSGSSGAVKIARAFGRENLPVPKPVAKYIAKNGLYNDYLYITERYGEFGLKPSRIAHIERVALSAANLAKRFGVSSADAIEAALLHDIAKETNADWFARQGMKAPEIDGNMPNSVRHAEYGAVIAEQCFGVTNPDIIEAVRQHTTGAKAMSKLAMVVFLADYIEEGRECETAEYVRSACRTSLEKGMATALAGAVAHLTASGTPVYGVTREAFEYYKNMLTKAEQEKLPKAAAIEKPASPKKKEERVKEKEKAKSEKDKEKKSKKKTAADEDGVKSESEASEEKTEKNPTEDDSVGTEKIPAEKEAIKTEKQDASQSRELALRIGKLFSEKKGFDVTLIDVRERTAVADYFVIAGANSSTQVRAIADYVDEKLSKEDGLEPLHRDKNVQWYAVDYGSVIMHVMTKSTREVYSLERLWSDGTNVETVE